jgi:hypothetical protein
MAAETLLYEAVFTLFTGFLIFISMILNRIHKFFSAIDTYFVLFLFTGIMMSLLGVFLMLSWNFRNIGPYQGSREQKKHPFVFFFAIGSFMIIISLTGIYYFNSIGFMTLIFRILSVAGIVLLTVGLFFFYRELIEIIRKTQKHSGILPLHNQQH